MMSQRDCAPLRVGPYSEAIAQRRFGLGKIIDDQIEGAEMAFGGRDLAFHHGEVGRPCPTIMPGGMINTVTSRCCLSNSPASIAIWSRPYTRMVPELSTCTNRHVRHRHDSRCLQRRHHGIGTTARNVLRSVLHFSSGLSAAITSEMKEVARSKLFRRCGVSDVPLLQLFGQPEVVMFLGPVEIDFAGAHRLECALHPERADVDVGKDQRDEQHGDDGVHHLRDLHPGDIGLVERETAAKAGYRDRQAARAAKARDTLLPGIEASGGRMFRLDEAASLLDPFDIDLAREDCP